jgi:hypothetical protein
MEPAPRPDHGEASGPRLAAEPAKPTPAARRLRAVSAFLLERPPLLLPVASLFREREPIFESAIRGPSMEPTLPSHARLRVRTLGREPCRPGDIAYFLVGDGYMVHRVVYLADRGPARGYLLTCGDNRLAPDPPLRSDRVLGTVIAVEMANGWRRALTLVAMIAALWGSAAGAGRLAALLLDLELAGRASVRRCRRRRRRGQFGR